MDVGIFAPVIGVVLAVVIVLVLWRVMRMRATKSAARASARLTESEAEFLDSSHIINGPISGPAADARRNATNKSKPPLNRLP